MRFGCRSRYISRYVNLKFGFLPFVVASIVAMVFLRRICSSRPGDGEQRRQSLAALTARGRGLDCFQPQPRQLVSTRSSRAPCALPNLRCDPRCWLFSCLGVYFHLRILPESTERSAAAIFGRSAPSLLFMVCFGIFCCQQDFPPQFHANTGTNAFQ